MVAAGASRPDESEALHRSLPTPPVKDLADECWG